MGKSYVKTDNDNSARQNAEGASSTDVKGNSNRIGTSDIGLYGGSALTMTDHNAVDKAFGFGESVGATSFLFGEKALAALDNANARATALARPDAAGAAPALQDTFTKTPSMIPVWAWAVMAALLIAAFFWFNSRGGA